MELPTFYGEVLPVLSRAVDDSDDDAEESTINLKPFVFSWTDAYSNENVPADISMFLLAHGQVAATFVESYFLSTNSWSKVADLNELFNDSGDNLHASKTVASIYLNDSCVCCVSDCYVKPEYIWQWIEQVFSVTKLYPTSKVITLSSCSVHEYRHNGTEHTQAPFVRALCSSNATKCLYKRLEQPNMAKGIPAAVLSYCEFNEMESYLYICYPETIYLDTASVQTFKSLLNLPGLPQHQEPEKALKLIINKAIKISSSNNLYM